MVQRSTDYDDQWHLGEPRGPEEGVELDPDLMMAPKPPGPEEAVLAIALRDPRESLRVIGELRADDFLSPRNRKIFDAMQAINASDPNSPIDFLTICIQLELDCPVQPKSAEEFRFNQLYPHLSELGEMASKFLLLPADLTFWIKKLVDSSRERRARSILQSTLDDLSVDGVDRSVARAQSDLSSLDDRSTDGLVPAREVITECIEETEARMHGGGPEGAHTGLEHLDEIIGGMHPGQMCLLAARPSVGKSALAVHISRHVAQTVGRPVAFFSLEMTKSELGYRLMGGVTNIDTRRLEAGNLEDAEWGILSSALQDGALHDIALSIDDTPAQTVGAMLARARQLHQRTPGGLSMVVIDHLHITRPSKSRENATQDVTEISNGVKAMSKQLEIPVLALCQLRRIQGAKPQLSDLRQSGALEQDADKVILLHRYDYENSGCSPALNGVLEANVAKNRGGPTGMAYAFYTRSSSRFTDLTGARMENAGIVRASGGGSGWKIQGQD